MPPSGEEEHSLAPQQAFENGCRPKATDSESQMYMVHFFVLILGTNYRVFMHPLLKVKETFHEKRDEVSIASVIGMIFPDAQPTRARTNVR